jgi:hypothetical protein
MTYHCWHLRAPSRRLSRLTRSGLLIARQAGRPCAVRPCLRANLAALALHVAEVTNFGAWQRSERRLRLEAAAAEPDWAGYSGASELHLLIRDSTTETLRLSDRDAAITASHTYWSEWK